MSKRRTDVYKVNPDTIEIGVRENLCDKISGTHTGIWLLLAEHLQLGTWDLLKKWTGKPDHALEPRIAMQMVHEAAICANRLRPKGSLGHQGFEIANGLNLLVTDHQVHQLLKSHSMLEAQELQIELGKLRMLAGDFSGKVIAVDPHRIPSATGRRMPQKKKRPGEKAEKMMQTFFALDTYTGQPICFGLGSSGKATTPASEELFSMVNQIITGKKLFTGDKEHFVVDLFSLFQHHETFDLLVPAPNYPKTQELCKKLNYNPKWAGYAISESEYTFHKGIDPLRLIAQRQGELPEDYQYNAFLTTSSDDPVELLTKDFPKRWGIEEFFNFEAEMGWDRASTYNLEIRYGKMTMALIAQALTYRLRKNLGGEYRSWTAKHLAQEIFLGLEGDIRVKEDTILVTYYNAPEKYRLREHYQGLPQKLTNKGIDPRMPWLYNFKLDFRFT